MGDVQLLPNGNKLITYSNIGTIHEIAPDDALVRSVESEGKFGYSSFRESLYGPPLR